MANTYTQLNIHAVFAVKGRENVITHHFKEQLFRYFYGILKNNQQYPLAINGTSDHVHLFFELHPATALSDIIRVIKNCSSKWINENRFVPGHFYWQEGYGAFSYSRSQRDRVIRYIMNQEQHHRKKTFKEEYLNLLRKFEINMDQRYLFEFYD